MLHIRQAIVEMYGHKHLITLHNLERLRLLTKRNDSNLQWVPLKRELRLIFNEVRSEDPDDIAYVTSGYAPISGRMIERAVKNEWQSNALARIPGPKPKSRDTVRTTSKESSLSDHTVGQDGLSKRKVMLVFFIGGVTFMEISALRFIGRTSPYDIVIATTKLVNGNTLIDEFIQV